jgi:hypothetical protein
MEGTLELAGNTKVKAPGRYLFKVLKAKSDTLA